ncbi:MAG: MBL fold metallo-hydrolase [Eubacteriales bacterium]|nr:MBL fold metallo-hydrolase [Eubacteriales bacterium]
MEITWLGTAAVRIGTQGEQILFDPFVQLIGGENPNCIDDFLRDTTVCVTHGHLDHLMEVPVFLDGETEAEATVYCGEASVRTLEKMVEDTGNVVCVRPGDEIRLGSVRIRVWEGRHARPGAAAVLRKLFSLRLFRYFRNALALAYLNPKFPERGQTLIYELVSEGKRVVLLGSLGLAENIVYPDGADLLILPYQGSARLEQTALSVVRRLRPKRIMLDHFDDAFPPVSSRVDTRGFKRLMDREFPDIPVVKPTAGKTITI